MEKSDKFREIFDKSPIGILFYDKDGYLTNANQSALDIAAISQIEDVKGTNLFDNPYVESNKEKLLRTGFIRFESPIDLNKIKELGFYTPTREGVIYIDYNISITDSGFLVQIQDITELSKVEDALYESESKYRGFFKSMAEAVQICELIFDEEGKPVDNIILDVNPAYEKHSGLKRNDVIGRHIKDILPVIEQVWLDRYGEVVREGKSIHFEEYNAGTDRWFDVHASPLEGNRFVAVFTDITERKKAEEKLRKSEKSFLSVLDNSLDALYRFNINTNQYEYLSAAFEDVIGFSPKEFMSMTPDEAMSIIHPDDLSIAKDTLARLEIDGHIKVEYRIRDNRGKYRWLSNHISLIRDDEGQPLYRDGTIRNVTEQKNAEEELRQAHDNLEVKVGERTAELRAALEESKEKSIKLDAIMNFAPDGIIITGGPPDFPIAMASKSGVEMTGSSIEELLGLESGKHQCAWNLFLPDGTRPRKTDMPLYRASRLGETVNNMELVMENVFGDRIPLVVSSAPIRDDKENIIAAINIWHDISEIKKAEEQISRRNLILSGINKIFKAGLKAESEEELAQIALNVVEEITGSSFGYIDEINPQGLLNCIAISFNGWEECIIPHTKQLVKLRDLPLRGIRRLVISEARPMIFNDANKHPEWIEPPEGHAKIKSFLGVPLIRGDKVFGTIALAHKDKDYTQGDLEAVKTISFAIMEALMSYRSRNSLNETISELERSNQELQSFAYITSHDLQEPLRTIASYAQLIERRYKGQLDNDADEFLDYMVAGATRMKQQIQGLLDYSRVGTQGKDFCMFNSVNALKYALSNVYFLIEENHAKITYDPLPTVLGDEAQITRVFQNLIENALKFHKKGIQPKIHISASKEDNEYIFSVSDNGIGIEKEYTNRIFEVFKRLHAIGEYEGAGIGLAIVKRIIEIYGGRVWVESELGVGSTFHFTIPIEPVTTGRGILNNS